MKDEFLYLWAQWATLNHRSYQILQKQFGNLEVAWKQVTPSFFQSLGMRQEKIERIFQIKQQLSFEQILSKAKKVDAHLICIDDANYPEPLRQISSPPPFLFVRGKLPSFHKSLAVVGTRAMTSYGHYATEKLTRQLVQNGFVIVSGLALGVDACAHQTALSNKGITVAVLGSGVDQICPATNHRLAMSILESGGAIVSTYPFGTPAAKHHFPERNEIVSALSRGVLVAEGGVRSGALITARLALEQGREVFAVPNDITKTSLSGTNHLIRKGEAKLVESAKHILDEFQMKEAAPPLSLIFEDDEKVLLDLLAQGQKSIDQLSFESSFSVSVLSQKLTMLQLKGAIREQGGVWVIA